MKETSVSGYIALQDLTKGGDIIRSQTYTAFMPLTAVALIYLSVVMLFSWMLGKLERKLKTMNEHPGNTPMFQISHLVKEFNSVPAVNDVTTNIDRGEVVFIVGPSGSGKSTFLRCLNLLEEPTSGEIRFKGKLVTSPGTDVNQFRQHVGMVFQHFNLFPHLTILEISLSPRLKRDAPAERRQQTRRKPFSSALGCTARGTPIPSSFPEAKSSASPSCAPWS